MNYLICLFMVLSSSAPRVLFDFDKGIKLNNWYIVDDGVMGGNSSSRIYLNSDGHGVFEGAISLENNGGFSSVRHVFEAVKVSAEEKIVLRLKGDGKNYQFRVKHKRGNYYSYIAAFSTTGEWQEVIIHLKDMYPAFRGRNLDLPNFEHDQIEEIAILIGNKKAESFELLLDSIEIR